MERLKKERKPVRAHVTRLINECERILEQVPLDQDALLTHLELLKDVFTHLKVLDEKIKEQLADDATDEDFEAEYESTQRYRKVYIEIKREIENLVIPRTLSNEAGRSEDAISNDGSGTKKRAFQLPTITLKQFDGTIKDWLSWWSHFRKIHDDDDLDDTDKFQYLSQAIQDGTEAKDMVNSYPHCSENYIKAVQALQQRYGRDDLQLQFYVRELLTLVISNVNNKEKLPLSKLFLKLESHLRCLATLKLDQADPATWLFPLVESSLNEETLRAWQRSSLSKQDGNTLVPVKTRLDLLMDFIETEVRSEQQISLAQTAFNSISDTDTSNKNSVKPKTNNRNSKRVPTEEFATAAGLMSGILSCAFCDGKHESDRCIRAQTMSYQEKKEKLESKKLCFRCLRAGHMTKRCKLTVKCMICGGKHFPIFCRGPFEKDKDMRKPEETLQKSTWTKSTVNAPGDNPFNSVAYPVQPFEQIPKSSSSTNQCSSDVLLNTLLVTVIGKDHDTHVRLVGDTGSQRSYVRSNLVRNIGCTRTGQEWIQNILFGGSATAPNLCHKFKVQIRNWNGNPLEFHLLERKEICGQLSKVPYGPWIQELKRKGIQISDVGQGHADVDILLGSDYWGSILTGNLVKLECGLVAIETIFGWTLTGRVPTTATNIANIVTSMFATTVDISNLWSLESMGIHDPIETQSKQEEEKQAVSHFNNTVSRDESGRYVVSLPWKCKELTIPTNRHVAQRRLQRATSQLKKEDNFHKYDNVFRSWEEEGLISELIDDNDDGHYLPHRPVFKVGSSTPVRPVFDASCKTAKGFSLNDVLYTGPNLLELIPSILLRFREEKIGISADIRKAFQMILVAEEDKKFQKFLWWQDDTCSKVKIYQHHRVVFGMTCSPFLLASTINYHLSFVNDQAHAEKLRKSFYVDNCVCSVSSIEEYEIFRCKAVNVMEAAGMELRQWTKSMDEETSEDSHSQISLLGLMWDNENDVLYCDVPEVNSVIEVTKRSILSCLARIFDPIGFTAPTVIMLKILLQEAVMMKTDWDEQLPDVMVKRFNSWRSCLAVLKEVQIPRHFQLHRFISRELHIFSDGSSYAYAAVIYIRTELYVSVKVQLLLAKSRLAPIAKSRKATIPRLELMGCLLGSRLATTVRESLDLNSGVFTFWSDSTTALVWIKQENQWGTFVGNRVAEIRQTTLAENWRHVPGILNPADLPSRGCRADELLRSRWWEGPQWLYGARSSWPHSDESFSEEEVNMELKKSAVIIATTTMEEPRFSSFRKNVAVWGWVLRFIKILRAPKAERSGMKLEFLRIDEMRAAEQIILLQVQQQSFPNPGKRVGGMMVDVDEAGLIRVQTRLLNRKDTEDFIRPILLPKAHPLVDMLIRDLHRFYGHPGAQFLIAKLREKYWILQTRRTVQRILRKCVICRRFQAKPVDVIPTSLPERRVSNSEPFQTTGVDLAGPLVLRDGSKAWIVLFTCAFYRCVYLDVVTSLSTESFIRALERFIFHYGRPNTIYSDNGTNFHGTVTIFKRLDWKKVEEESRVREIQWIFNPPTAAWWGGWWERLIRSIKDLLKRMLGTARLSYDELRTCVVGVAATINDRPLTVVTEDEQDLIPLTPAMFIRSRISGYFPETKYSSVLQGHYKRMKVLQTQLQERFRKEYLSLLVQRGHEPSKPPLQTGDIVLVGVDNKKRFHWPLGLVIELIPGRDGKHRVAKVKTSHGILLRPIQRLFPLEISAGEELAARMKTIPTSSLKQDSTPEVKAFNGESDHAISKSGRILKRPASN